MEQFLTQLLYDVVGVLTSIAAGLAIRLVLWAVKKYKVNVRNGIVSDVLKYVEHKFRDLVGSTKFNIASQMISKECAKHGIKVDSETVEMLIESGLKEFKLQFGEQWKSANQAQDTAVDNSAAAQSSAVNDIPVEKLQDLTQIPV